MVNFLRSFLYSTMSSQGLKLIRKLWRKVKSLLRLVMNYEVRKTLSNLQEDFPFFAPSSAGTYKQIAPLIKEGINQLVPNLVLVTNNVSESIKIQNTESLTSPENEVLAAELKNLCNFYGTEKPLPLYLLYANILSNKNKILSVAEIGLGTNNTDVVSNMGAGFAPGASQRAFRDFLPNARIYGADVDKRILFNENRIICSFVDQTVPDSINMWLSEINEPLDLIIDDGLHSPNANLATLACSLQHIKEGGWIIIEDIGGRSLDIWFVVAHILSPRYLCQIFFSSGDGYIFAVQRPIS